VLHSSAPNIVAFGQRVQVVGPERIFEEVAPLIEELGADVQVKDVALVVKPRDDAVDLRDLVAHGIARHTAREDGEQQNLRVGEVVPQLQHYSAHALSDFRGGGRAGIVAPARVVGAEHQHDGLRLESLALAVFQAPENSLRRVAGDGEIGRLNFAEV